jgi:NAD(P)-dependent dehydrogenase (short-subunit alcohol dehydrogenase family)
MLTEQLSMTGIMAGKVALVTGASSGFGAHFSTVLAAAGARVIVAARRAERLETLVKKIQADGGTAMAVSMDVTDRASVIAAMDAAEAAFGAVTVLINNAGVARSQRFETVEEADFDFVMETNVKGAWRVASEVSRRMIKHRVAGSIVNIASILALGVLFGESSYAISKAAVAQMTKAMALELGRKNIRVNALCPGYFKTEINADFFDSERGMEYIKTTPAKRLGEMHEITLPLLLLASDAGSFINGVCLPVDGGHLLASA